MEFFQEEKKLARVHELSPRLWPAQVFVLSGEEPTLTAAAGDWPLLEKVFPFGNDECIAEREIESEDLFLSDMPSYRRINTTPHKQFLQ